MGGVGVVGGVGGHDCLINRRGNHAVNRQRSDKGGPKINSDLIAIVKIFVKHIISILNYETLITLLRR